MDNGSITIAILGAYAFIIACKIAVLVLLIIAYWKIFNMAGEAGWKSLIPIYNGYILYKISWNTTMFWVRIALAVAYGIFSFITGYEFATHQFVTVEATASLIFAGIIFLAIAVISIMGQYKLAKSFGYGVGFTLGLVFLTHIFILILGFDKSEYIGPEGIPAAKSENIGLDGIPAAESENIGLEGIPATESENA